MYLGNAVELHKDIISKTIKKEGSLLFHGIGAGAASETGNTYKCNEENITAVNASLNELIVNYFLTSDSERKIVIQFDRLDDNYNQYQDLDEYYQATISRLSTANSIEFSSVLYFADTDDIFGRM